MRRRSRRRRWRAAWCRRRAAVRVHTSSFTAPLLHAETAWCLRSSTTARDARRVRLQIRRRGRRLPSGLCAAPGAPARRVGAPCVPFRRPRAAEPASLRVFHVAKTATTSLVKELEQCVPARVRTDEGCWSGVNRETWTANLTAPSATGVLLRHPRAHLLHVPALPLLGLGPLAVDVVSAEWDARRWLRRVAGTFPELRERAPRVGRRVAKGLWWTGWGCYHPLDPQTRAMTCENRPGCADNLKPSRRCRCAPGTGARMRR